MEHIAFLKEIASFRSKLLQAKEAAGGRDAEGLPDFGKELAEADALYAYFLWDCPCIASYDELPWEYEDEEDGEVWRGSDFSRYVRRNAERGHDAGDVKEIERNARAALERFDPVSHRRIDPLVNSIADHWLHAEIDERDFRNFHTGEAVRTWVDEAGRERALLERLEDLLHITWRQEADEPGDDCTIMTKEHSTMTYHHIEIYTDGGCSGNPGPGGWAFTLAADDAVRMEKNGGERMTTNNKMELEAVINALEEAKRLSAEAIVVNTDSQYVKNGITLWIKSWKAKGWKTADRKPVKNQEYWLRLDALVSSLPVTFRWVKGHAGIELNERCDTLVQEAIDRYR